MPEKDLTLDEVRKMAAEIGMTRLTDEICSSCCARRMRRARGGPCAVHGRSQAGRRAGPRVYARTQGRTMTDLAWLTVAEAAELLRGRKLSPVEYAKALIARIERHDGKLNAFLRFTPELALEDARRAEAEIARGEWRGPFHGVPYGLKDIVDYAGLPTTAPFEDPEGQRRRDRRRRHAEAACRGRRLHGQALDARVRHRRTVLRPAVAAGAQSVEPGLFLRRLLQRLGRGDGGGLPARGDRHRHRRLGAQPGRDVRRRRHEAHLRRREPARRVSAGLLARSRRARSRARCATTR